MHKRALALHDARSQELYVANSIWWALSWIVAFEQHERIPAMALHMEWHEGQHTPCGVGTFDFECV